MTTRAALTIVTAPESWPPTALYCHNPEQGAPKAVIYLDLQHTALWVANQPDGNSPQAQPDLRGGHLVWQIPCMTAESANRLLHDVAPLAEEVIAAVRNRDGSGAADLLDGHGRAAIDKLTTWLDEHSGDVDNYTPIRELSAEEWWAQVDLPGDLTATTTPEQLDDIVDLEERYVAATANAGAHTVLLGAREYLTARRDEMRDVYRAELERVAEQAGRRNALIALLTSWGDSTRATGRRARLTHVSVIHIARTTPVPTMLSEVLDTSTRDHTPLDRATVRARLRTELVDALVGLTRPLAAGETAPDREDDVTTGSATDPGVYRKDGQWLAWDYAPDDSGDVITVTLDDLRS